LHHQINVKNKSKRTERKKRKSRKRKRKTKKMGKAGQSIFSIVVVIQLLVTGVGLGLSSYILSLAPTLDNVLSIVFVAFTG